MIMENPAIMQRMGIELPVPIVVDVSIGNWGIGKEMGADFRNIEPLVIKDGKVRKPKVYMLDVNKAKRLKGATPENWEMAKKLMEDGDRNWKFVTKEEYYEKAA